MPKEVLFQVVVNGAVCSADLETLRQWVREGRVGPNTVATRDDGPPFPLRHLAELREAFQATIPLPPGPPSIPSPVSASAASATATPTTSGRPVLTLPSFQSETRSSAPPPSPKSMYQGDFPNERHRKDPRYIAAMKYIRRGSWTGMILAGILFLGGGLALTVPADQFPVSPFGIHIGLVYLAFATILFLVSRGLHSANRLCAVLLFLWFGAGLAQNLFVYPNLLGGVLSFLVTLLYLGSMIGAFEYHQFRKAVERGDFEG